MQKSVKSALRKAAPFSIRFQIFCFQCTSAHQLKSFMYNNELDSSFALLFPNHLSCLELNNLLSFKSFLVESRRERFAAWNGSRYWDEKKALFSVTDFQNLKAVVRFHRLEFSTVFVCHHTIFSREIINQNRTIFGALSAIKNEIVCWSFLFCSTNQTKLNTHGNKCKIC